ncbi:MAG: hypothetical protein K8F91_09145, partial [Candidatus Obscuribacterales bacterium]|nr:hypothetical protein [Candidatus Obscuribacterales bacterium]
APTLANLSPDQDIDWPEPLEALIAKALAKDPGERFGTAKEMSDSIAKLIREVESLYSETEGSYGDHLHPQEIQANAAITEKNRKTLFLIAFSGIALTLVATAIMYQNLTRDPINSAFKQYDEISKHTDEADDRNSPKPVAGTNDFNWQRGRLLGSAKLVSWATAVRTVKDADLRQLESQTDLKHLDLSNSAIDGSGFSNIAHLPLLAVNASSTKLNNNGLEQLCSIPSVSRLELNNLKNVDGDGICKLVNLPKLSYLSLHECKLVDQDISALAKLNNLHSLNLGDNKGITNLALQRIIEVNPKLTGLYIGGTGASIEILSSLDKDKIRALGIHDLPITSEQLADLPFKKLFIIAVGGKNFSDTHLLALSNFKHMKILIIIDAPSITEEGLIALQKKLPACRVSRI